MKIGLHVRVAGGYANAVAHCQAVGANAMQVFSTNPRSYRTAATNTRALAEFAELRAQAGIAVCVTHTPYLVNLGSVDEKIFAGSVALLENDLAVAGVGEIRYVNTHLGSYGKRDREEGFTAICRGLARALAAIPPSVVLVLENSAGAGSLAGGTLEELGRFVRVLDHPQLGVCLDTAHAWAAGYEIDGPAGVGRFIDEAAESIGLDRIHLFHFNDTEVPLGGNRDRHHHIGDGNIGFAGFAALLARPELLEKTAILETPGSDDDDKRNMETILTIARGAAA
ncbi:MAG: deoxyribonuclease IV [Candidatus Tyrphobacter sp.]